MNAIKTLTALSIGLAAVVPAAHADRGNVPDSWRESGYERSYGRGHDDWRAGRRIDDRRVVRPPVYVPPPARRVVVERPVYVQPAPVYHEPYPRYYEPRPAVNGGTIVGAIGGAIVGSMIGGQIGYGEYQGAATVAGAVIGGAIGSGW
jgi:hypothetical protein